jgi:hypothetical protein
LQKNNAWAINQRVVIDEYGPWRALGVAVVELAVRDARKGCKEAQAWLSGPGLRLMELIGADFDAEFIEKWIEDNCKRSV